MSITAFFDNFFIYESIILDNFFIVNIFLKKILSLILFLSHIIYNEGVKEVLAVKKQNVFGKRVRHLRDKIGKTQEDVANAIGLSRARYSHYENGRVEPDIDTIKKLANYYDCSTDYLLGYEENNNERTINIAGQDIKLTSEEKKIFEEMKKHPVMFNDLASDPERKIKRLIKMWEFIKEDIEEMEDEEDPDDIIEDDD